MNLRFIDWIWHVRGRLPLAPGQAGDEALDRLVPLFCQTGTSHERTGDRLTFRKKNQAAQDKMSIFDGGSLHIGQDAGSLVMHYNLASRALLFCFLAPFLFLGFAQLTLAMGRFDKAPVAVASKLAEKAGKQDVVLPRNAIDKALGSPAPEMPKKNGAGKNDDGKKKPSPVSAYVFAGIFAVLYVCGRLLESVLVRNLFRKTLIDESAVQPDEGESRDFRGIMTSLP